MHIYAHMSEILFHLNITTHKRSNDVSIQQIFSSPFCHHSREGNKSRTETSPLAIGTK